MRHPMLAVALVLSGAAAEPLPAQAVRVQADPRVELMAVIFRLAGNREYNLGHFEPYNTEVARYFAPFREHEAVVLARELREKYQVNFGAPIQIAIGVTDPPELRDRGAPLDSLGDGTASAVEVRRFLEAARRFAVDTRFGEFFAAHRPLYDTAVLRLRRPLDRTGAFDWLVCFFGVPGDRDFFVVPMLVNSETSYGPCVQPPGARRECYQVMGHHGTDADGFPVYEDDRIEGLVHEATHGYTNPIAIANFALFDSADRRIYARTEASMEAQAYGDPRGVLIEGLVRAAVARYIADVGDAEWLRGYLAGEHRKGWLIIDGLSELFGRYEADRGRYPTFQSFLPRMVAYFDTLADRLPELQRQYDTLRPQVVSLSIANGSNAVDPATREIVVRFDRPVIDDGYSVRPVRGAAERLPNVTWRALDADSAAYRNGRWYGTPGTTLRLGVELEPARAYELQLNTPHGMGVRSAAEGAPLAPVIIRFRTSGRAG